MVAISLVIMVPQYAIKFYDVYTVECNIDLVTDGGRELLLGKIS